MKKIQLKLKYFIDEIITIIPALRPLINSHIEDFDVLLPYVFMGDITRFVVANLDEMYENGQLNLLMEKFNFYCIKDDREVSDLISLGFFENLIGEDFALTFISQHLTPCLALNNKAMLKL